ncbi:hypothetical protein ACFVYA_46490 [Amycolatopsis sp. NPDC058278]|uniref:hypothetical protein n=1 Tax=Amycolatopsis sp. NPDC058278 TaxID=3346417 RepID=UPI0036DB4F26
MHRLDTTASGPAELFGNHTGFDTDKFTRGHWQPPPRTASPELDDCPAWYAGEILSQHNTGGHVSLLLHPVAGLVRLRDVSSQSSPRARSSAWRTRPAGRLMPRRPRRSTNTRPPAVPFRGDRRTVLLERRRSQANPAHPKLRP